MSENPKGLEPSTTDGDQELTSLIEQCAAFDAAVEKLTPEERAARFAPKGLAPDATDEEFEKALQAELLADPAFEQLAQDFAEAISGEEQTGKKPTLDEATTALELAEIQTLFSSQDPANPHERRYEILAEFDLSETSSDEELEQAARSKIAEAFAAPVRQDLADQLVAAILECAKKPTLDEAIVAMALNDIKERLSIADSAERRHEILAELELSETSSDEELEQAARSRIAEAFAAPVRQDLADQLVAAILEYAKV